MGRPWLLLRGRPEQAVGLTGRETSSALPGGAGEAAVGEEAGWCHRTESRSPRMGPCPGPAGDGPGTRSGGEAPRVEAPGGALPGRSGEELGEAGWPAAAVGAVKEE